MSENGLDEKGKEKGDISSDDKKKIADEEKEKMIEAGEEKEIRGGEVEKKKKALEEVMGDGDKRRIPIGGIKIPGFLKSTKSKEKTKDGEDNEEGADLLEQPCNEVKINEEKEKEAKSSNTSKLPLLDKFSNLNVPFMKRKKAPEPTEETKESTEDSNGPRKPNLINAIKLPLANLVPKKKNKDGDDLGTQQAGLASMETLDDDSKHDDGMENIILESVDLDPEKAGLEDDHEDWALTDWKKHWAMIKQHKLAAGGIFIFVILFLVLIITVLAGPRPQSHSPLIDGKYVQALTSCGFVEGIKENTAFVFRSIPYAKPPIGELRFRPPEPHRLEDCWDGVLKVYNESNTCWQIYSNGSLDGDENCLTLEIYTPHIGYDTPLPVIVVIGTESLLGGWPGGITPTSDLAHAKEVVVVRPNFRLGSLGFLAAAALSQTTYPRTSGNYGLADIVRALEWVKYNIEHFGGDPKSVTVLGHKAGGTLVAALTTILKPEKLFARVWISSASTVFPNMTLIESERQGEEYLNNLPCNTTNNNITSVAECLRKLEIEDMLDAVPDSWRLRADGLLPKGEVRGHQWLVEDGKILRQHPLEVWSTKNLTVQVVIGTTLHVETTPEWWEARKSWTEERLNYELNSSQIGAESLTERVKGLYETTTRGLASIVSDISTLCPLYNMHKQIPSSRFYLVTHPADESQLSYGGMDIDAFIGPWPYRLDAASRRYLSSMRNIFYNYVAHGKLPEYKFTNVDQDISKLDVFEIQKRCTLWKEAGFDKFAKFD